MIAMNGVPQIQNDPIYSLPHLYISGMNISVASNTIIAIAPGQCRDMNDVIDMPIGFPSLEGNVTPVTQYNNYMPPLLINTATVGANGLDQGTLAASSNYIIYVIGDSRNYNPVAGLISLYSNPYPLMPFGYDSIRMLGFVSTNGSTHFTQATVLNAAYEKAYYLNPAVSVLSGGNATTFTAIDCSTPIPTTTEPFVIAYLLATFIPSAANDIFQLRPTGSTATSNITTVTGITAGVAQTQYVIQMTGVASSKPEIDYLVSSSSDSLSLSVVGYSVTLS